VGEGAKRVTVIAPRPYRLAARNAKGRDLGRGPLSDRTPLRRSGR